MKKINTFLLFFLISCRSANMHDDYSLIRFKEKLINGKNEKLQDYIIEVPKGGRLIKADYEFTGDFHMEYRIYYSDSSIFYIGNSNWTGSKLNIANRFNIGIEGINKKHENDSLYFSGIQKDGRYWKEEFLGDIIVGYINVNPEKKLNTINQSFRFV